MYEACVQYGYTLKDIAEFIGVHLYYSEQRLKKLSGKMKSDIARFDPLTYYNMANVETTSRWFIVMVKEYYEENT
jgi:hypothetical protein